MTSNHDDNDTSYKKGDNELDNIRWVRWDERERERDDIRVGKNVGLTVRLTELTKKL